MFFSYIDKQVYCTYCCRYLGSVRVGTDGNAVAFQAETDALACERRELAESLRKHAAASNPAKIAFKFGYECVGADLKDGAITFKDLNSDRLKPVSFDLLVGADGQCSRVRDILEDQVSAYASADVVILLGP